MRFIYALNEHDKEILKLKGYKEISKCTIDGKEAYCFDNTNMNEFATFSNEEESNFLITDVALFV